MEALLSIKDLANYLQVPERTLRAWRAKGSGPRSIKLGKHVRYRETDVAAWLNRQSQRAGWPT